MPDAELPPPPVPGLLERIDERKDELNIGSDQALCRAAGLSSDYIRATIRRNKEPGVSKLLALARALNCSLIYLVEGKESSGADIFDEARMTRVLENLARFQRENFNALKPAEFAELAIHLYRENASLPVTMPIIDRLLKHFKSLRRGSA